MNEYPYVIKKLYPMECPKCSHILSVISHESSIIAVNPMGSPVDLKAVDYNNIGVCLNCGYSTNLIKIGNYFARDTKYFNDLKMKLKKKYVNL